MTIARRPGEPLLGNPDADGKVLSSTTAGVRSWVPNGSEVLSSVTVLSTDHPATWTADPDTNVLTSSAAHGLTVNRPIAFGAGTGALPGGLSPEPEYYYVIAVPSTTTLQVSLTYGGAAVDITDAGTAGWVVKNLPSGASTTLNVNVPDYDDIDIYWSVRWAAPAQGAYPLMEVSGTNVACMGGGSSVVGLKYFGYVTIRPGASPNKYNIIGARMSLRRVAPGLAHYRIDFGGRHTANPDLYTGRVGLYVSDSGLITYDALTAVTLYSGAAASPLSGATAVVVRRP